MSTSERLSQDMKDAMRAKEEGKLRLSVIRMIKSAAKYQEIEKGSPLSEEEWLQVISKELKQRRDVLPEYEKNDRKEMAETIRAEIGILMDYLPRQLEDGEILAIIQTAISETAAKGPKDMGKVMGKVSAATKGKADGRRVSELVKETLAAMES
jgi:hypothetical protein